MKLEPSRKLDRHSSPRRIQVSVGKLRPRYLEDDTGDALYNIGAETGFLNHHVRLRTSRHQEARERADGWAPP